VLSTPCPKSSARRAADHACGCGHSGAQADRTQPPHFRASGWMGRRAGGLGANRHGADCYEVRAGHTVCGAASDPVRAVGARAFAQTVTTGATVVPYKGKLIGEGGRAKAVSLDTIGLPVGLEMIVAPPGVQDCRRNFRAGAFERLFRDPCRYWRSAPARMPRRCWPSPFSVPPSPACLACQPSARTERQIVELRRTVEMQTVKANHLLSFLEMLRLCIAGTGDRAAGRFLRR
jgi:hypothetical protein